MHINAAVMVIKVTRREGAGGISLRRKALRAAEKAKAGTLMVRLRWVPSTPRGLPVVPEV